ncbi:MAG TPA: hypothetical protein VFZ11_06750 [Gemmatimonadaceae bacterium]
MPRHRRRIGIGAFLLLAACAGGAERSDTSGAAPGTADSAPVVACTMIGCEDQLVLRLAGAPAGPFRVELQVPGASGDSARRTFECPAGQTCSDIPFPGFVPERVTARIVAGRDTTVQELTPTYRTEYPNGPQCPPGCRIARESVTVRSGS